MSNINKITDSKEKFDALTAALDKFGISEELLTAQTQTVAVSFDKLKGATDDATASLGQLLGQAAKPFVDKLTVGVRTTADALSNLNLIFNQTAKGVEANNVIFAKTTGFDEYKGKIDELNAALPAYAQKVQALTPVQYAFGQSLINTGSTADQAFKKIQQFQGLLDQTSQLFERSIFTYEASGQALDAFAQAQLQAANTSDASKAAAEGYAQAIASGGITLEQGTSLLIQYTQRQQEIAAALADTTSATTIGANAVNLFTQELTNSALEASNAAVQSDALKLRQQQLTEAALAAARGMGATLESAAALAAQFGITTGQAYGLISALLQLEVAKAKKDSGLSPRDFDTNVEFLQATKDAEAADKANKARLAYNYQIAKTAEKLELDKAALARTTKGTEEYYNALAKVAATQKQLDAENNKPPKAPKLTPNEKINTSILDQLDKYNDKFEDAEQKHYDKLAKIYEDYAKKQNEQIAKNEVDKRRSRISFYDSLNDAKGIDKNAFAQQYEDAFTQAQKIAQEGKAKLAAEFLDLRTRQIQELQKLAEEEAAINEKRNSGEISKKDAEAELAYLEGKKKLIEDAQAEEQKQLLAAGDDNQKRLQEQLDAENAAYADQADKIMTEAERAANAKITHAERSKIAVDAENKSLATQESIYARIAAKNGGVLPRTTNPTPQATQPLPSAADTSAAKPVNVEADKPIPVDSAEGILVRQASIFFVQDDTVNNTLADIGNRLESRLTDVVNAVLEAKESISSSVRAVESAVGRIKIPSAGSSVVQG